MQAKKLYNLIYYPEITSTNTYAVRNINEFSDRDVLMAEIQTEGRGRFDRKWISDKPDNIYISFVLKPKFPDRQNSPLNNISQYLSVKLCEVLEIYGVNPVIKWPNDVLVNNKKIAGILAQTSIRGENFQGLVLGIGVNLNFEKQDMEKIDRPATSLNLVLNKKINRDDFLNHLLEHFFGKYDEFLQSGFGYIKNDYVKRAYFLGNTVTVNTYSSEIRGKADKISDNGELIVVTEEFQKNVIINMGEILEF